MDLRLEDIESNRRPRCTAGAVQRGRSSFDTFKRQQVAAAKQVEDTSCL